MSPRRSILTAMVVLACAVACWGMATRLRAGSPAVAVDVQAEVRPAPISPAPARFGGPALSAAGETEAPQAPAAASAAPAPAPGAALTTVSSAQRAAVPALVSPSVVPPVAGWAAPVTASSPAKGHQGQAYVDPAAQVIAAMTGQASGQPAAAATAMGGGGGSGGTNNLAPRPGGAGLVINDGRIPVGFVIDPREYIGGVLHIDNASGTPAILTINDPAAAAACSIAGEPVVVGRPYQVDNLDIVAAHPVAVFVQPGRAPPAPAGPKPPRSDG